MNLAGGRCEAVDFYQIEHKDLLVICDDMALPLGKLRFRHAAHMAGTTGYATFSNTRYDRYSRLRIGVDVPRSGTRRSRSRARQVQADARSR